MGMDIEIFDAEDGYLSDSLAVYSMIGVLEGVCKPRNMIAEADGDEYDNLIAIVHTRNRTTVDEEAMLVTALKTLSGAVSKIDADYHSSLLSNIFDMPMWYRGLDARNALLELVTNLAAVPDKFLDSCLHMLVANFAAPKELRDSISQSRWLQKKQEIHTQLHNALHYISELVPLAPMMLKGVIDRRMPRPTDTKERILMFVECILSLVNDEIGEFVGNTLLGKVVDLLVDLDVNISWEDILLEDNNQFHMELEDTQENAEGDLRMGTKFQEETRGVLKGNAFADKLDGLMVIIFEHLKSCACNGRLFKAFEALEESFRRTVLNAYKSKFAQFVMFYACSLDPERCGKIFADLLTDIFVSKFQDPISRMSAVAYLASYLCRARFVSSHLVANKLKRLIDWCVEYCQVQNGREISLNPRAHRIFYSGCQAVLYILCFRMRSMMEIPELRSLLFNLPLLAILQHPLAPLKVCLPTIVDEFRIQATYAGLVNLSLPVSNGELDSSSSRDFGGSERLDMFFPFDPYLLSESDRFIRPSFEFWRMVRTPYQENFEEEDDDNQEIYSDSDGESDGNVGPDGPCIPNYSGSLEYHETMELDAEEDIDLSMEKMSITPKSAFNHHPKAGAIHKLAQMPARLELSVSPNW